MSRKILQLGAAAAALLVCLTAAPACAETVSPPAKIASGIAPTQMATPSMRAALSRYDRISHRTIILSPRRLSASPGGDLKLLRRELAQKLEALNAPAPAAAQPRPLGASAGLVLSSNIAAAPARPMCRPSFDTASWPGTGFNERRAQLRARIADRGTARMSLAELAELYLAHGLAAEALDAASEGVAERGPDDIGTRLRRDADLAHLMKGEPITAASPLLAAATECERPDLALWQGLAAAASHDAAGIARAMVKGQSALRAMPDPVRSILAYRLADAVDDTSPALPLIADSLRNTTSAAQEDKAAMLLLDARIATAKGERGNAAKLLAQAASTGRSLPAVQASVRLAEMAARAEGPLSAHDEKTLWDFARLYRDNPLGQGAAADLADRKLRENNFPAALAIADQSARAGGRQHFSDRGGAAQIAGILRMLLVSPRQTQLPPPAERAALFLRYQGYATPGAPGDDIRLAAAQLLLAQGLPQTALDVAHQLAPPTVASPPGLALLATAEAQGGDPAAALDLLRNAPTDNVELRHAAAFALARLDRPAEAARQLDGLTALPDRLQRARLLAAAKDWSAAATAYAALLRDPDLTAEGRSEASDRYGLAVVLSGGHPDHALALSGDGLAARALAVLPAQPAASAPGESGRGAVAALRDALQRARTIDTLLPSANSSQGA